MTLKPLAAVAALAIMAGGAHAATYTYDLMDHPDGTASKNEPFASYGLRLDVLEAFYSFERGGAEATLVYDDEAGTATITGTMLSNDGPDPENEFDLWDISYEFTGITDLTGGFFTATGGSGMIKEFGSSFGFMLEGKQDQSGLAFSFTDTGHRLDDPAGIAGWGWVDTYYYDTKSCTGIEDADCDPWKKLDYVGYNDFLFTGTLDDGGDNPDGEIPLPAAGWMLLAGVGALRVLRRHRS